jgi:hypothetical protein
MEKRLAEKWLAEKKKPGLGFIFLPPIFLSKTLRA